MEGMKNFTSLSDEAFNAYMYMIGNEDHIKEQEARIKRSAIALKNESIRLRDR